MDKNLTNIIRELEVELLHPDVRKSTTRLNELLSEDFFEFGSTGKSYSKQDVIRLLKKAKEAKFTISDFKIKVLSPDVVLATYSIEKEDLESSGKSWSLRSSLWQNHNGNWQIIFHQGTPVKKEIK